MDTRSIDGLNIALMLVSCLLAFIFPFHLFLFSYAVLGPLHYFTEIPWLHKKSYYTGQRYDYVFLLLLAVLIAVLHYLTPMNYGDTGTIKTLINTFAFTVFAVAVLLTFVHKNSLRMIGFGIIGISAVLISQFSITGLIFASLVPTIIHVFIFTGAFVLYGALRNKSAMGIASLVVFVGCTAAIFLIAPSPTSDRSLGEYVQKSYLLFAGLNFDLMNILGLERVSHSSMGLSDILFRSNSGIIIMRLIAFSYTYHFLNWFSKTSIIKWHQVSKRSLGIILLLWLASLGLYFYNYEVGLQYLYLVSLIHVVLEFPLDQRTFVGIGKELSKILRPASR